MEKNIVLKKILGVIALIAIALTSIFGVSKVTSSPEFHKKTIQSLDEKKITVMELTAATAGASTALALIPSDATTPLANQIARLSSYLLIVIGAIFLEKILLTLTGGVTFSFLIPIACLLFGIYLFAKKDILRKLAIKLVLFGIVIFLVVPTSVYVSNIIENTYQSSIDQTIESAQSSDLTVEENENEESKEENESWWSGVTSSVKEGISSIGDSVSGIVEKGKKLLSNFIDAIAVLLITSCVIPIVVLLFFIWIVKMIFGISIPTPILKKENTSDKIEISTSKKLEKNK